MIGKRFKEAWHDIFFDDSEHQTPLDDSELVKFSETAARYLSHWNDASSSLSKWILATLITLNSGGLFFLFNLGLHPYAVRNSGLLFFFGISSALLAAVLQFARIERMRGFVFRADMAIAGGLRAPTAREYRKAFNSPFSGVLAVAFGSLSLWLLFEAGGEMIQAMRPCTAEALQESEFWNSYQIPGPRGSHHSCYFYEIKGVPLDPLQRAHWEQKAEKLMLENAQ